MLDMYDMDLRRYLILQVWYFVYLLANFQCILRLVNCPKMMMIMMSRR